MMDFEMQQQHTHARERTHTMTISAYAERIFALIDYVREREYKRRC